MNLLMKKTFLPVLLLITVVISAFGQPELKKRYKAVRTVTAPVINGIPDDVSWQPGNWIDDFTQYEPYNGRSPSQRTEFKILFDDNNLYVAIRANDTSPDSIISRLARRDNTDGDMVGIILDSFHDRRTGFMFSVGAGGVKFDQMFTENGDNEDPSWDPVWWAKTSVTKEGWTAEMKIPFSQLRFDKNSDGVWGLEVVRQLYRKNETSLWQHIPKDAPGMVHLFGELEGFEKIRPGRIFDITRYGVGIHETYGAIPENPFLAKGNSQNLNGGIDSKLGITNNITMDLTVNPDFGQVEADPSVVNLTAYETFFTEKRPFFIEGNNITSFGIGLGDGDVGNDNLFYSRRIGRRPRKEPDLRDGWYADLPGVTTILGAAKITGKTRDGLSLGFINAVTEEEKAVIDTSGGKMVKSVEPLTNYTVGRIQKDINNGNTIIGGIFTGTLRHLDEYLRDDFHRSAFSGGVDFTQYFKEKQWMINVNSAFSLVKGSEKTILGTQQSPARYFQRPDNVHTRLDSSRTSLSGSGGRIQVSKLSGHWNFLAATLWRTPGFETNDLGYIREADHIISVLWAGFDQWEPKGIYRNYNVNLDVYSMWNFGGENVNKGLEANASMTLKNFWRIWSGGNLITSGFSADMLRGGPMMKIPGSLNFRSGFSTDNRKKIGLEVWMNGSAGFVNNSASISSGFELSAKPMNYLLISVKPEISRSFSELQYITKTHSGEDERYIFGSIDRKEISASFRMNCNITPDISVQYWGQPFIATGKYSDYKHITDPLANSYSNRFRLYHDNQIATGQDEIVIDENEDGIPDYSFDIKDFNVREFLSNLVIRWEYNPGSTLYFVWNQTRNNSSLTTDHGFINDLGTLFDNRENKPHNIFLVKFSYRFGIR